MSCLRCLDVEAAHGKSPAFAVKRGTPRLGDEHAHLAGFGWSRQLQAEFRVNLPSPREDFCKIKKLKACPTCRPTQLHCQHRLKVSLPKGRVTGEEKKVRREKVFRRTTVPKKQKEAEKTLPISEPSHHG